MRIDHVSYACGPEGLDATTRRLAERLGVAPVDGGFHPAFGTRNQILPLRRGIYVEVVEPLEHPSAQKTPFGTAVRDKAAAGGGWFAWAVAVADLEAVERRLGRPAVDGRRTPPRGEALTWKQIGINDLLRDKQLPFFIHWISEPQLHPSLAGDSDTRLAGMTFTGSESQVEAWIGPAEGTARTFDGIEARWLAGAPTGIESLDFATPAGAVTI